ncbi:glycoside hydrolase 5 family protein [Methylocystis parvus]|uniref:mannan endo-1,4-beta-mannosidase n=1 Tax=Methylocystis parvus TaxID=134 RepID=A0A6B8M904_9HYPH|nr:cellulase family glycosylhydrolase [Methylocystis parvus]QGM99048.1 cellulase family glycosylhydrolase [Methylocystis parvus]WBK00585.1 cellulase family glycosylhydrolase [Methylocystis parvus OBBP]
MIGRPLRRAALSSLAICAAALHGSACRAEPAFVKAHGYEFQLEGRPFHVAGVNNHYLTFGSQNEVTRVLDDAAAMGANVVRTFLQPVIGSKDGLVRTIWDFKSRAETSNLGVNGNYLLYWDSQNRRMAVNEEANGVAKFDFLVAEASKRGLRLIVCFLDFWDYTGGVQQIRAWYGSDDKKAFFFEDSRTKADYRKWVRYVIERTNPLTGRRYRDDPTIFGWELANEPDDPPKDLRASWIAEMSSYVKSLDPNHLVASGLSNVTDKLSDISIPTIDYSAWHGYPLFYDLSVDEFDDQIREFCAIARKAGKPALLEEFGYARSNPNYVEAYQKWLKTIQDDPDCAGWLVWRLVSRQDSGAFPVDEHDQFDVHNDGGALWRTLRAAAEKFRATP